MRAAPGLQRRLPLLTLMGRATLFYATCTDCSETFDDQRDARAHERATDHILIEQLGPPPREPDPQQPLF